MAHNTDPSQPYLPNWPTIPNQAWWDFLGGNTPLPLAIDKDITPQEFFVQQQRRTQEKAREQWIENYKHQVVNDRPDNFINFETATISHRLGLKPDLAYLFDAYEEPVFNTPYRPLPWQTYEEAYGIGPPPPTPPQWVPTNEGLVHDPFHYPPTSSNPAPTQQEEAQQVEEEEGEEDESEEGESEEGSSSGSDSSFFSSSEGSSEEEDEEELRRLQTAGLEVQGDPLDWEPF
jgi:hypothetical protein